MIEWFEKRNKLSWGITILIAIVIFYLSSLVFGTDFGKETTSILSLVYHVCAFFFLSLFLFISMIKGKEEKLFFILAIAILLIYGISDEIHQFFVPGRFCAVLDLGFNSIGILFAFMVYMISIRYRKITKTN